MNDLVRLFLLSVAVGAISMVVTKSPLLNKFHSWVEKRSPFLEEMLSCPWCTSHWVAGFFVVVFGPIHLERTANWTLVPLDYIVSIFAVVGLASVTSKLITSAYDK